MANIILRISDYLQEISEEFLSYADNEGRIHEENNFYIEIRGLEEDYKELSSRTSTILRLFKN
jgi:hypothetical protein